MFDAFSFVLGRPDQSALAQIRANPSSVSCFANNNNNQNNNCNHRRSAILNFFSAFFLLSGAFLFSFFFSYIHPYIHIVIGTSGLKEQQQPQQRNTLTQEKSSRLVLAFSVREKRTGVARHVQDEDREPAGWTLHSGARRVDCARAAEKKERKR